MSLQGYATAWSERQQQHGCNTPCGTFSCFPRLPVELRIKVWTFASFQPRNVGLWAVDTGGRIPTPKDNSSSVFRTFKYWSNCPTPVVLHVSQESRMEGLKWYRRSFYVHRHCDNFTFETEPKVYFNPASDRLCLQDGLYMGFHTAQVWRNFDLQFSCFVERGLRSIAINIEPFLDGAGFDILDILTPPMRSLEEILIYRYNDDYGGNLGHLNEVTDYQFEEIEWSYSRDLREIMPYLARTMARINGHLLTTGWKGDALAVTCRIKARGISLGYRREGAGHFFDEDGRWVIRPSSAT